MVCGVGPMALKNVCVGGWREHSPLAVPPGRGALTTTGCVPRGALTIGYVRVHVGVFVFKYVEVCVCVL